MNKSDRKSYLPLSPQEQAFLAEQNLVRKDGKLNEKAKRMFRDLDQKSKEAQQEDTAREVAEANAPEPFPMEDAVAMGLTEADIEQAKTEGVTSVLGLRRIEKNNRGTPKTLF